MLPPVIVNISRLHRETAAVVQQAEKSDCPVFVTQHAYVAAVLLPRRLYDRLLRAAEKGAAQKAASEKAAAPRGEAGSEREVGSERDAAVDEDSWTPAASPLEGPLSVFGPLPPRTKFLTKHGLAVDAQLAAFLMEEGEQVRPILKRPLDEGDGDW
jgi:prevent-host-death family protein